MHLVLWILNVCVLVSGSSPCLREQMEFPSSLLHLHAWTPPRPQVELRLFSNYLWVTTDLWDGVWVQISIPFPEQVFLATKIHFSRSLQPKEEFS